jgi:hypothetical protein
MTLPLLTSITHCYIFITRHARELMADDRSGRMTKMSMSL